MLFIIALWTRHPRRKAVCLGVGLGLLLFFSNPFIIRVLIRNYETKPLQLAPADRFSAGIVLGGFVSYNKQDDQGYFNPASDRFIQTALLYKQGHIGKIIVAAGNGYIVKHDFKEANFIKKRLVTLGISPTDILTDSTSRNTLENALNTRKILDATALKGPFLLISSSMHLPRASFAFTSKGIPVIPYACDFDSRNVGNNFLEDYLLPSALAINKWDNFLKEVAGTLVYRLKE